MPRFTLEIELGNDAMRSDEDIARALKGVAEKVEYDGIISKLPKRIRDINGNTVGHYEVRE